MATCYVCSKETTFGNKVSHSVRRSSRSWKPNLRRIKIKEGATPKTVYVCTRCIRSNSVTRA